MARILRIFQGSTNRQPQYSVGDIAARCADAVMRSMRADVATMQPAELQGYVRACALPVVRAAVQRSRAEGRLPAENETELAAGALERTMVLVLREYQAPPIIAIASPHVSRRAA